MSPRWLYWPTTTTGTLGTMIVSDANIRTNVGGVEQSIQSDGSTSLVNGASGLSFVSFNFYDGNKNQSWDDAGLGLLLTTSSSADATNHSAWVALLPSASGTFYVYEAGTSTEIFRLNWTGSGSWAADKTQRYGSTAVDFEGAVAADETRADIYYS